MTMQLLPVLLDGNFTADEYKNYKAHNNLLLCLSASNAKNVDTIK